MLIMASGQRACKGEIKLIFYKERVKKVVHCKNLLQC